MGRLPLVDLFKAGACVLIVWHHLAFYGPMSDVVHAQLPWLIGGLYDYGRMAVQVFLVVGGYLCAASLAPHGSPRLREPAWRLVAGRYRRLVVPYIVALGASMLAAAAVRPWFDHASVPAQPELWQLLSHLLFVQDLFDQEALSAGVWYVAIDFQLFVLAVLLLGMAGALPERWTPLRAGLALWLAALLTAVSLLWLNRWEELDSTALYFFGAYGLGMVAYWAAHSPRRGVWLASIAVLGVAALLVEFRLRIAIALVAALLLATAGARQEAWRWADRSWVRALSRMSYSIFLVHFAVCLLVNALVHLWWPGDLLANALGLFAAFGLSVCAGKLLYLGVEARVASRVVPAAAG